MDHVPYRRRRSDRGGDTAIDRGSAGVLGTIAWTAGVVSGWLFSMVDSAAPSIRRLRRRFGGWPSYPDDPSRGRFISWRRRLIGRSKQQIADALGSPPAAAVLPHRNASVTNSTGQLTAWDANTWYYPYDPERHSAVAIEFRENRVARIEFIGRVI